MAITAFANSKGVVLRPYPETPTGSTNRTLDGAGDSVAMIGHIYLTSGEGSSKTISSSGGKIYFRNGTVTFANAGTTIRVGIQDVASTGLEDTTFDVYDDLVGGTDTITASAVNSATMSSGTKTITHGDLIAVVFEMTARGGADSVIWPSIGTLIGGIPYVTHDSGGGLAKLGTTQMIPVTVEFDDGTMGWFGTSTFVGINGSSSNIASNTTPDEVALIFTPQHDMELTAFGALLGNPSAARDFDFHLYSDPLGTPSAIWTVSQDADLMDYATSYLKPVPQQTILAAGTQYALAFRPTTTNTMTYQYIDFGSGNGNLRKVTALGTNWSLGTRSDQTGAFTEDLTKLPRFELWVAEIDDGAGGGGGETSHVF